MTAKFITDIKEFKAACASITKRGLKLDHDIQHAALSAANQVALHGNTMYVNMLYLALQRGARKSAMTEWLLKYAGVMANTEASKKEMPFKFDKERAVDLAGGALEPWYDCKPDAEPDQSFDVIAALRAVIKKAQGKNVDAKHLLMVENLANDMAHANDEGIGGA